ncbi:erythromycin esterase family protein [Nocardia uniformis]|uniref:Erythromycin esterase family protein n=1 Tax=Nocardia uniformis TaxID=53432 RepID=A0A849BXN1_9NOCA|nr:erythromycin esterase family protein [Nocardia uniformis]NNH69978.1 erythromycin esterase family protein [Nocardia uniformis]
MTTETDIPQWIRDHARPVAEGAAIADAVGGAVVVGLGESTRFSRETFRIRRQVFQELVLRHGFRVLAVQDTATAGERLDNYVRTGAGDARGALSEAWRPWRTEEMAETLDWIAEFNRAHPDEPVRVIGVEPTLAEPSDYEVVLAHLRRTSPAAVAELNSHYAPIRTAHTIDEHVQRAQGTHPGRPFADHARDGLALVTTLRAPEEVLAHARRIVDFHENSVAGRSGFGFDEGPSAQRILDWHHHTRAKIAYWDGIAHVSALSPRVGRSADSDFISAGGYLAAALGAGYVSVAIGFHHGDLGIAVVPEPADGWLDAMLGAADLTNHWLDLRDEAPEAVDRWRRAPATARTISGIYSPDHDADEHIAVESLSEAFHVLVHIREVSPLHWLRFEAP